MFFCNVMYLVRLISLMLKLSAIFLLLKIGAVLCRFFSFTSHS